MADIQLVTSYETANGSRAAMIGPVTLETLAAEIERRTELLARYRHIVWWTRQEES